MHSTIQNPLTLALASAVLATVAGCGGSDDNDSAAPPPARVMLNGTVMRHGALKNAVVCMDLNANSACDRNEPASNPTDANGAWSLTYETAQVSADQVAAASVIALLTSATTDEGNAGESVTAQPYVLRQVPGKSGQINPLTTLVAKGISDGMTEATARSNVALQLGLNQVKIDNYQDDPAFDAAHIQDNARTMALVTDSALEDGAVLQVGDQMAAVSARAGDLVNLNYTDSANYNFRFSNILDKAAGSTTGLNSDQRIRVQGGAAVTDPAALYPSAYLTPSGWRRCAADAVHTNTVGNPSRVVYCDVNTSVSYSLYTDVGGQSMASVVQMLQTESASNTINNGAPADTLIAALGSAAFPEGSQVRRRMALNLSQPLMINNTNTDARPQAEATTLEQLVTAKPAMGVNLATAAGTLSLGMSTSTLRSLRVAFTGTTSASDGKVQFYECDLNAANTVASNCNATNTGTYRIDTVNGARVMRFDGYGPTPASAQDNFYAEVHGTSTGDYIFRVRQTKPTLELATAVNNRLNATAWAALKTKLGL